MQSRDCADAEKGEAPSGTGHRAPGAGSAARQLTRRFASFPAPGESAQLAGRSPLPPSSSLRSECVSDAQLHHVRSQLHSRFLGNPVGYLSDRDDDVTAEAAANGSGTTRFSGGGVNNLTLPAGRALEMSGEDGCGGTDNPANFRSFHWSGRSSYALNGRLASAGGAALLLICGAWLWCLGRSVALALAYLGVW